MPLPVFRTFAISGTISVNDLFLSRHVLFIYLAHGPTYKINVLASIYVEQFLYSTLYITCIIIKSSNVRVYFLYIKKCLCNGNLL